MSIQIQTLVAAVREFFLRRSVERQLKRLIKEALSSEDKCKEFIRKISKEPGTDQLSTGLLVTIQKDLRNIAVFHEIQKELKEKKIPLMEYTIRLKQQQTGGTDEPHLSV